MPTDAEIRERKELLKSLKKRQIRARRQGKRAESRKSELKEKLKSKPARKRGKVKDRISNQRQKANAAEARKRSLGQQIQGARKITEQIAATPGTPSPVIDPFMSAEDILALGGARSTLAQTLADTDYQLETTAAENQYEKAQIDRASRASRGDVSDDMAARGLFNSSIRDAELFDIDATANIRRNFLDRAFDTQTMEGQRRKLAAETAFSEFQQGMNQKMVENARAQSEALGLGPWLKEPTAASTKTTVLDVPRSGRPGRPGRPGRRHDHRPSRPGKPNRPNRPPRPTRPLNQGHQHQGSRNLG